MLGTGPCAVSEHAAARRTELSDNYRLYAQKVAEQRAERPTVSPLYRELIELLRFVLRCEADWVD
jgi:hypothetical protein